RAGRGRRAGRRARALARHAVLLTRNLDRRFRAARRLFEGDLEVVAEIGAALRTAAAAAAEQVADAEDVAEIAEEILEPAERGGVEPAGAGGRADARMAEPIVQPPLFIVREDRVGLRGFLELLLGGLVARIAVRVMLHRELAIRALDFRL